MRLPNFLMDASLNELRSKMEATQLGDLVLIPSPHRLTLAELERLISGGIDIESLDEVRVLQDGTLAYKDRRVMLYIRDVPEYGQHTQSIGALPRFHVSNCAKLREMRAQRRWFRYVVATREDGQFQINLVRDRGAINTRLKRLRVCQYCLGQLRYEGFHHDLPHSRREAIVEAFTPQNFFKNWPLDLTGP